MHSQDNNNPGWADRPKIRQRILYAIYAVCALLVIIDLLVHRHTSLPIEEMPAFYAFYGFAALVGVVMLAKALRRIVGRDEDYYEQQEDEHV